MITLRRRPTRWLAAVGLLCAATSLRAQRISDSAFASLVIHISESGGYFDSDNIITNEASYLQIASQLQKVGTHGGVYMGVGPDQNFSYIAMIRPRIAFMIDIRRDNLLEHLLFKSYFAVARNRLEYLCLLFGKPVPADIDKWTGRPPGEILAELASIKVDSQTVKATAKASNDRIMSLGVPLDAKDRETIDRYRATFVSEGLDTRYSSIGRNNRSDYPSFGILMLEKDREGHESSYLADETAFQFVRSLQMENRIVPIVGNVAGKSAIKNVADYANAQHLVVSAFYLSNVEQYLMGRNGGFDAYAKNVKLLPHDSTSVIIRSYFGRLGLPHPLYVPAPGNISTSMIERMSSFLSAYAAGQLQTYGDLTFSRYITPW
ncbi:MAG: hypothetical protein ABI442_08850 [Gemmatimonadaceae bacterium]